MASAVQEQIVKSLERILDLRRGDLGRGFLLSFSLFLIAAAVIVGKIARDALFLNHFPATQLPYADIGVAVLVGFVVAGSVQISSRFGFSATLLGTMFVSTAVSLMFWLSAHYYNFSWLYPILYVWAGIFGVLAPAQLWTLCNRVLTTREAKRLFGLIGAGAITGWIFAGAFSRVLAQTFGTESLLLVMAILSLLGAMAVALSIRGVSARQGTGVTADVALSLRESLRRIWFSKHLRSIAVLICLSSFVTTIVGWQFKAIAKQFLANKDALASFFGDFNFYAGIIALAVQLLLASRLLRRFGVGPVLMLAPLAVVFTSVGVLVWGSLLTVILLRGSDQILRYSLDKPAVELLYLPVPASIKVQVKTLIDTVIWRIGDGLAGIFLLVFATALHVPARQIGWITLLLAPPLITAAFYSRRSYVATLRNTVRKHQLDAGVSFTSVLDRDATMEITRSNLSAGDSTQMLYAMSLFDLEKRPSAHSLLRDRLSYPDPAVRRKSISILRAARDPSAAQAVEPLLRDPNLQVRTEAMLYLSECSDFDPLVHIENLGDFPDFSIRAGLAAFLANPGESQNIPAAAEILDRMVRETGTEGKRNRLEAARLLAMLPPQFPEQLIVLLADSDQEVAREAIRAVVKLREVRLLPQLIELLAQRDFAKEIQTAVASFGDSAVGLLGNYLADLGRPPAIRRRIPVIFANIRTQSAADVLVRSLIEKDIRVRTRVLSALRDICKHHPATKLDTEFLDRILTIQIMEHCHTYQILEVLKSVHHAPVPVLLPLREAIEHQMEQLFAILGLRYPRELVSAYFSLQSDNASVHDNALEYLDNVLDPELRRKLVPLLDARTGDSERAHLAERITGRGSPSLNEAVTFLLASGDPWLKRCGIGAAAAYGLHSFEPSLDCCSGDADPAVREAAQRAKCVLRGTIQKRD
jgi:AAA family ATP:ADP antiporter